MYFNSNIDILNINKHLHVV